MPRKHTAAQARKKKRDALERAFKYALDLTRGMTRAQANAAIRKALLDKALRGNAAYKGFYAAAHWFEIAERQANGHWPKGGITR